MPSFKEYREEINHIFAHYTRRGFVDYRNCRGMSIDMINLMENATKELSHRGEYKELFDLACKGFLKWGKTNKDDSDGGTQEFCWYVEDAWKIVYEANDKKISHNKMFEWFTGKLDGSVIDYMEDYLYSFLRDYFKESDLLQKKYDFYMYQIEARKVNSEERCFYDFQKRRCQEYLLQCMADMKKPIEEIRKYAETFKSIDLLEIMAEIELNYGNTDQAIVCYEKLARQEDERNWARENWHLKLRDIYKGMGNQEKYLQELKAGMRLAVGNIDLWREYKACFAEESWPEVRDVWFSNIRVGDFRAYPWYAEEDRYDLIMDGLEVVYDSDYLKTYEKTLKKLYPERILIILVKRTVQMAEEANKRQDYRKVARMLSWMQKYPGGEVQSEQLADEFCEKYKRRRAMMEEISQYKSRSLMI